MAAAVRDRKAMIAFNPDGLRGQMPTDYKSLLKSVESTSQGRKALARFRKFWGLPYPTNIQVLHLPGPQKGKKFLVGMGNAGQGGKIELPDGKTTRARGVKYVATDADGKQIFLLSGRDSTAPRAQLKKVGRVIETHYVPTADMESAGTHKRGKYWVHRHTKEEQGKPPPVYVDQAGNYVYGRGTYRVSDWIRR